MQTGNRLLKAIYFVQYIFQRRQYLQGILNSFICLGLGARKPFLGFVNNKGTDQPAHPHRLLSIFAIRFLESIISKLAKDEISIF